MQVFLVWGSWRPDGCGVTDYTRVLAEHLAARGTAVTILASGSRAGRDGTPPRPVALGTRWGPAAAVRLVRAVRAERPDVVNIQYAASAYGRGLSLLGLLRAGRALTRPSRWVLTMHEVTRPSLFRGAWRMSLDRAALAAIVRGVDRLTTTNEAYARNVARMLGRERCRRRPPVVIPIGTNIPVVGAARAARPDGIHFVYFGLFRRGKGISDLLAAFARLLQTCPSARLSCAGNVHPDAPEYYQRLRTESHALGIEPRVTWMSGLPADEVSRLLSSADACVLPFPGGTNVNSGSLMAAIAHGIPVIATGGRSAPDGLADALLLVDPGDRDGLARAMAQVALSPSLRERLRAGVAALQPRFAWDRIAEETYRMYRSLCGQPAGVPVP